eukprot:TRINITY_DN5857_c0_g2_i3.p2 TRINITY_DN5857_c0_g2~~TRINITY_DN5857_c0_g2_i3.p2  ORF type:complete len:230 (-),score=69.06 TRINITY_DN5857_c0_g2_i3:407-1096(-)
MFCKVNVNLLMIINRWVDLGWTVSPPPPEVSPKSRLCSNQTQTEFYLLPPPIKVPVKKQDITITGASTLSDDEVDKMVKEAEKFSEEDSKKRKAVDTKNNADQMVYQTRKQLEEFGEKVPADMKTKIEGKVSELEDAVKSDNIEQMEKKMEELRTEAMQMGQAMYGQGGGAPGADGAPGAGPGGPGGPGFPGGPGGPGAGPSAGPGAGPSAGSSGPGGNVVDADFKETK